jgi:hypothetical protein
MFDLNLIYLGIVIMVEEFGDLDSESSKAAGDSYIWVFLVT